MPWSPFSGLANIAGRAAQIVPGELRDIAGPVEMPDDPVWHFYVAGVAGVLLVAAILVYFARRRRPVPVLPPAPPQETALEALNALECAAADPKSFYTRLVETLRAYIAGRFGVDEPDDTASELLAVLFRSTEIAAGHQRLLRTLVAESDLVKFAGRLPAPDAPARALAACRSFVRETAHVL